jgi:hypothetical protein
MFLGLPDLDPDPFIRGMEPDSDPSIIKQKSKETLDSYWLFSDFFMTFYL